jgi:hypothetical protein
MINRLQRLDLKGALLPDYMRGMMAINTSARIYASGTIDGYYLGNDRVTPRFKIRISDTITTDWKESSTTLIFGRTNPIQETCGHETCT